MGAFGTETIIVLVIYWREDPKCGHEKHEYLTNHHRYIVRTRMWSRNVLRKETPSRANNLHMMLQKLTASF